MRFLLRIALFISLVLADDCNPQSVSIIGPNDTAVLPQGNAAQAQPEDTYECYTGCGGISACVGWYSAPGGCFCLYANDY
jgi:hypothetical protein